MRPNLHVIIITQTRDKAKYMGYCEDVPIIISNVVNYTPILIIAYGEQDLILGQLWQKEAGFAMETAENRLVKARIYTTN